MIEPDREDYERLREMIHRHSGLWVSEAMADRLRTQVRARMDMLALDRYADYHRMLLFDPYGREMGRLLSGVTIGETFFFRDYLQLTGFAEEALPLLLAQRQQQRSRRFRVMSAGCATGEEPYTLAMILSEMLPAEDGWDWGVLAFDLNDDAVAAARQARYYPRSTRDVPVAYRARYLIQLGKTETVSDELRSRVTFVQGNVCNADFMSAHWDYDVVFFRNVLIYFSDESRRRSLGLIYDCLRPGGAIYLGYAEFLGRFTAAFQTRKIGDSTMQFRPTEVRA